MPPGCYLDISKIVKDYFKAKNIKSNAGLDVPIIAVGKLGYPDLAENAIRSGQCDMIMLARPLLADPQWPTKAYLGKCSEICPCIGDQEACFNEFIEGGHPQCAVNPRTGNEDLIPAELIKTDKPKRVAVIGAGAAGVMCAVIAAKRGHNVELFDANSKPGGVIIAGSASSCKIDLRNYLDYLANQINGAVKENGLKANFNTKVTLDLLKKGNYEAIVFALGGIPKTLKIPGIEQSHVIQAIDLYKKPELAKNAKNVVVIGGGSVGCEAAHMLAYEMNKTVKLVEILPNLMPRTMSASRFYLIHYLEKAGVEILNCTTPLEITSNSVKVQQNISSTVPDPYISWTPVVPENIHNPFGKAIKLEPKERDLDADLVVIAAGLNPNSDLYEQALKAALPAKLYNIGDSFATGRIFEATKAGFHVGRSL
jgi:2-enoate reductase